jgi:hypothetical protein
VGLAIALVSARGMQPGVERAIHDDGAGTLREHGRSQYALLPDVPWLGNLRAGLLREEFSVQRGSLVRWGDHGWVVETADGGLSAALIDRRLDDAPVPPSGTPALGDQGGLTVWRAGWPWPSVQGWEIARYGAADDLPERGQAGLWSEPAWREQGPWPWLLGDGPRREPIPYRPAWPGLVADGAVFGMLAWLLWSGVAVWPWAWRRRRRIRDRRCVRCGHRLGLTEGPRRCPECGADA